MSNLVRPLTTPTTPAGRALLDDLRRTVVGRLGGARITEIADAILAIEQEARADLRAELKQAYRNGYETFAVMDSLMTSPRATTPPASAFHRADPDGVDDLFGTGEPGDPRNGAPPATPADPAFAPAFTQCPVCDSTQVVRLVDDWTDGRAIPIVGCGNPWHYTTWSLGDLPQPAAPEGGRCAKCDGPLSDRHRMDPRRVLCDPCYRASWRSRQVWHGGFNGGYDE